MKKISKEEIEQLINGSYTILQDPKTWAASADISKKLADINKEVEDEQIIGNPQNDCDHGVVFNEEEARFLEASEVRKRFPRCSGPCPKGCGFNGASYASYEHYVMGDW